MSFKIAFTHHLLLWIRTFRRHIYIIIELLSTHKWCNISKFESLQFIYVSIYIYISTFDNSASLSINVVIRQKKLRKEREF